MIVPNTPSTWERAAKIIRSGGVIAFRTDTFYGLGADPLNKTAVGAIRRLKGREEAKPILVLISDVDQAERLIKNQSETFIELTERFWPGPLTIVGLARENLPEELTAGTETIGIRLPADETVRGFVKACGGALTATSANLSGNPAAKTAAQVQKEFPSGVDLIIDSGEVDVTLPSTVVDATGQYPEVIREGAIPTSKVQTKSNVQSPTSNVENPPKAKDQRSKA